MKRLLPFFALLSLLNIKATAEQYEVTFGGNPDSVRVVNWDTGDTLTLLGNQTLVLGEPVSIEETPISQNSIESLVLYPNPTKGEVTLDFYNAKSGNIDINIHTVQGSIVASKTEYLNAGKVSYAVSNLSGGMYIVSVKSSEYIIGSATLMVENSSSFLQPEINIINNYSIQNSQNFTLKNGTIAPDKVYMAYADTNILSFYGMKSILEKNTTRKITESGIINFKFYFETETKATRAFEDFYYIDYKWSNGPVINHKLTAYIGADDLTTTNGNNKSYYKQGDLFNYTSANDNSSTIWQKYYEAINECNEIIMMSDSSMLESDFKKKISANCRFFRAIIYFDLIQMFGEIPLVLNTNYVNILSNTEDVLNYVISELEYVDNNIINVARDTKAGVNAKTVSIYASSTAAKAYLAKAHMAMVGWPVKADSATHWNKVKEHSKAIIDNNIYSLLDDYSHSFGNVGKTGPNNGQQEWEGNKEAIWSYVCDTGFYFSEDGYWLGSRTGRFNGPSWTDYWQDFQLEWHFYDNMRDDYRKQFSATDTATWSYWGYTDYSSAITMNHPVVMKFQWGAVSLSNYKIYKELSRIDEVTDFPGYEDLYEHSNDIPVMRYAEVILMYAEACAMLGETAEAKNKLNWVRRRAHGAGLPCKADTISNAISAGTIDSEYWKTATPAIDYAGGGSIVDTIIQERAWEFVGEVGGVRWFDLTRREMVNKALTPRINDSRELVLFGDPSDNSNWHMKRPIYTPWYTE